MELLLFTVCLDMQMDYCWFDPLELDKQKTLQPNTSIFRWEKKAIVAASKMKCSEEQKEEEEEESPAVDKITTLASVVYFYSIYLYHVAIKM